jgi:hypothetical protein
MASPKNNSANTDITIARPPVLAILRASYQRPTGHQNRFPGVDEGVEKQVLDELNQSAAEGAYNHDRRNETGKDHEYKP